MTKLIEALRLAIQELQRGTGPQRSLRQVLHVSRSLTVGASSLQGLAGHELGTSFLLYLYLVNLFYNLSGDMSLDEQSSRILKEYQSGELAEFLSSCLGVLEGREDRSDIGKLLPLAANSYVNVIHKLQEHFQTIYPRVQA